MEKDIFEILENVRTINDETLGLPLFCAKDACALLGYSNPRAAISRHVSKEDKVLRPVEVVTGLRKNGSKAVMKDNLTFVTESGLYSLILGSKMPEALDFRRMVTSVFLPTFSRLSRHLTTETKKLFDNRTDTLKQKKYKTYLMIDHNTHLYKIGKSENPKYRERTLQSEKPSISILLVINADVEKILHERYSEKRIRGEWFCLSEDDIKDIKNKYRNSILREL